MLVIANASSKTEGESGCKRRLFGLQFKQDQKSCFEMLMHGLLSMCLGGRLNCHSLSGLRSEHEALTLLHLMNCSEGENASDSSFSACVRVRQRPAGCRSGNEYGHHDAKKEISANTACEEIRTGEREHEIASFSLDRMTSMSQSHNMTHNPDHETEREGEHAADLLPFFSCASYIRSYMAFNLSLIKVQSDSFLCTCWCYLSFPLLISVSHSSLYSVMQIQSNLFLSPNLITRSPSSLTRTSIR